MNRCPELLYKYTSSVGVECLIRQEIKVSPPHHFNDPFEFFPGIVGTYSRDEIESDLRDKDVRMMAWDALKKEGALDCSFADFERNFDENKSEVIRYVHDTWPMKIELFSRVAAQYFGKAYGIYCLSANCLHQLMWSHYADGHRGLVFGLDPMVLCGKERDAHAVSYCDERAVINHRANRDPDIYRKLFLRLIVAKSRDWSYEEEFRLFFMLRDCSKLKMSNGQDGYFFQVAPSAFRKVILGSKISRETATKVLKHLTGPTFAHVILEHAVLHKDRFVVESHPITLEELEKGISGQPGRHLGFFPWLSEAAVLGV